MDAPGMPIRILATEATRADSSLAHVRILGVVARLCLEEICRYALTRQRLLHDCLLIDVFAQSSEHPGRCAAMPESAFTKRRSNLVR